MNKIRSILICGVLLILAGFTLQTSAEQMATKTVKEGPFAGSPFTDDNSEKAFRFIGEDFVVLGSVFIALGTFTWLRSPA